MPYSFENRMSIKAINTTLLVITVIGTVFAYRAGNKHRQLLAEQAQLEAEFGQMPIADPSKVYVLALETGEELHFAWRVHFPAKFYPRWQTKSGRGSSSSFGDEGIAPVVEETPISPGRHQIVLRKVDATNALRYTIEVDDQQAIDITVDSKRGFCDGFSSSVLYEDCEQLPPDVLAVLYRGRFAQPTQNGYSWSEAPTNGILLWLEPVDAAR
jgi:hypothetical protein